ncbi:DUF5106 domain-containing protein [Phocaeicola coprophilus]|uniref:DUF5106 domain-containing protein n=1 Tax=Phocaeicola coprophilus TaxID=387090 RepID=UPI0039F50284
MSEIYIVTFVIIVLLFSSCGNISQQEKTEAIGSESVGHSQVETGTSFPFPEIPAMLTQPEERKAYLLEHYWDRFNFGDTTLVNNREVTEQGFVNQISLLADGVTPEKVIRESLKNWCSRFMPEAQARQVMMQLADDYLYNPNSPFYNEGLYGVYLETMLEVLPEEDARRSSFDFKLRLLRRNKVGDKATDFSYYLPDGQKKSLVATSVRGNRLLLVFYDPECESCHEVLREMTADASLAEAVKAGRVTVLAVYTEGNQEAWRKGLADMPEGWIIGTDRQKVKEEALYDLKAMPSLYLLDGQKRVLLKDAPLGQIREVLGLAVK